MSIPINYVRNIAFKTTVTKCFHRIETLRSGTMKLTQRQAKYIRIINS